MTILRSSTSTTQERPRTPGDISTGSQANRIVGPSSPLPKLANVVEWGGISETGAESVSVIMSKKEHRWALLWSIAIVGLTCLPYLLAWQLAPADTQYTGLLINHFDGESYYAKMQQGARGDWLFHLAFTPEPHEGAFIFTFYLALGHLAAALGLSIPLTYHLARAAAGLFFLLVAYRFLARFFERMPTRRAAFLLLGTSAGFGWLLTPFGVTTADLWVAEGFTFLSIFANPHFPLAIGLMLLIFLTVLDTTFRPPAGPAPQSIPAPPRKAARSPHRRYSAGTGYSAAAVPASQAEGETKGGHFRPLGAAVLGLLLAVVQPFAVPIALAVLAAYLGILALRDRRLPWRAILIAGSAATGAAPVMVYDLYVYRTNPALAAWSAQNLTPSLPPWNYALGYGLVLLLAIGGIAVALRRRRPTDLFPLAWLGSVVVLLYVPFALQRRFITGLHVPLTLLAAASLEQIVWPRFRSHRRRLATGLIVGMAALTNVFVPLVSVAGVAQGRPPLVMTGDEAAACAWLRKHTACQVLPSGRWTDTALAPPDSGQFVPAWAGNRVVYGHPFETINANAKQAEVTRFYSAEATTAERRKLLARYGVRYVLAYPLETDLDVAALDLVPAWAGDDAVLYRVEAGP